MLGFIDILPKVQKPLRYVGGEWNAIVKDPAKAKLKIALAFPDTYEIGMSHLGLRILYHLLNQQEDFLVERVFAPWTDMERELRKHSLPLCSLENHLPLGEFDVLGFSLQYELSYTNLFTILDLGRIPLRSGDRGDHHPFIIAGGPCAFNPEPIADFIDAFLIGDGEEAFPEMLKLFATLREKKGGAEPRLSRKTLCTETARIPGWYVPLLYTTVADPVSGLDAVYPQSGEKEKAEQIPFPIERRFVENLSDFPFPSQLIVPNMEIVHDRVAVEISRGCMEGCRFCQAGIIYRPLRERRPSDIYRCIMRGIQTTGYDDVSLTSLSAGSYCGLGPLVETLMEELEERKVSLSLSSIRADALSDKLARQVGRVRRTGFTIAPEAGTQRLRDVINKGITEADILQSAVNAFRNGWHQIKMYFMIGLPTETWEDVEGIVRLGQKVLEELRSLKKSRRPEITVSVSTFIPKPFTPFQWDRMEDISSIRRKQEFLRDALQRHRLTFKWHHTDTSFLEGVFARGDRRLGSVLEQAWRSGCRFDGWSEELRLDRWLEAFAACNLDPKRYLEEIAPDSRLPWEHLTTKVTREHLQQERRKAQDAVPTPSCLSSTPEEKGKDKVIVHCSHCGLGCDPRTFQNRPLQSEQDLRALPDLAKKETAVEKREDTDKEYQRYQVSYGKDGLFRFASHLDLIRTISRTLDRAEIRLRQTQGYHPKPALSFGPALGLGVESTGEWLELESTDRWSENEFLEKVNACSPQGLRFSRWQPVPQEAPGLNRLIDSAEYMAEPKSPLGEDGPSCKDLAVRMQSLLESDSIPILRKKQEQEKTVDIRPVLQSIRLAEGDRGPVLHFILSINGSVHARPEEVLGLLLENDACAWRIQRNRMGMAQNNNILSPPDYLNTQWTGAKENIHAKRVNCQ